VHVACSGGEKSNRNPLQASGDVFSPLCYLVMIVVVIIIIIVIDIFLVTNQAAEWNQRWLAGCRSQLSGKR